MKIIISLIINSIILISFSANAIISNAVEPVKYFVNHSSELEGIENKLLLHKKASIVGISGIGKTQIVRMYAHKNQNKYSLIWFFDCNTDLDSQYASLASEINKQENLKIKLSENILSAKNSVMKYLESKKDWLLVFDNLKLNENHKISEIISFEHNGNIIINSQDDEGLSDSINVSYLNNEDTIKLLNIILKRDINFKNDLSSNFKGYPIFITNAATFLDKNKHLTLEEYNKILNNSENKMKNHIELVTKELSISARELLYKISLINNQRFSKELLKTISEEKTFIEDLQELIRFDLISAVNTNTEENHQFEMHDMVRDSVVKEMTKKMITSSIQDTIDKINKFMPKGKNDRQLLISQDDTLLSNIEQLLINAEVNNVDDYKILELRKNLMSFYVGIGSSKCKEMKSWFKENKNKLDSFFINDHNKSVLIEYQILIGIYECYIEADVVKGIKTLKEAYNKVKNLEGYFELKLMSYSQLAQAYVFLGDQKNTKIFLEKSEKLLDYNKNNLDSILVYVVKSRYNLAEGNYKESLINIDNSIKIALDRFPENYYVFPLFTMKSETLNYMNDFLESYNLARKVYDLEISEIKNSNAGGYRIKIIVELSRAELGLGKIEEALFHANEAIDIYTNDKSRDNENILTSKDIDLASSYVAQAEALAASNKLEDAIKSFAIADIIFYNVYGKNMYTLDNISYMYYRACIIANKANDNVSFDRFKNKLVSKFGANHFRVIELDKLLK